MKIEIHKGTIFGCAFLTLYWLIASAKPIYNWITAPDPLPYIPFLEDQNWATDDDFRSQRFRRFERIEIDFDFDKKGKSAETQKELGEMSSADFAKAARAYWSNSDNARGFNLANGIHCFISPHNDLVDDTLVTFISCPNGRKGTANFDISYPRANAAQNLQIGLRRVWKAKAPPFW